MICRIIGTGTYLPTCMVTYEEICRLIYMADVAVFLRTGIRSRHWVCDVQCTSHLAEMAARQACESAGVSITSADAILVSTTSPDMTFPSTACHLQRRLGGKGAAAFDLAASCSGFLYGLSMADRLV